MQNHFSQKLMPDHACAISQAHHPPVSPNQKNPRLSAGAQNIIPIQRQLSSDAQSRPLPLLSPFLADQMIRRFFRKLCRT
jgi:hypothetical protein